MALSITYTALGRPRKEESGYRYFNFKLQFGDGVATYGTGLALNFAKLGCPNSVKSVNVYGHNEGYSYNFDPATGIMHIYQVPAASALTSAAPLVELASGATPAATTIYVEVIGY